jgi:hypothetical protein
MDLRTWTLDHKLTAVGILVAVAGVLVAASGVIVPIFLVPRTSGEGSPSFSPSPSPSPQSPSPTPPDITSNGERLKFFDNFEGNGLDTHKWQRPSTPEAIYHSNGTLIIEARPTSQRETYASLVPKYNEQPIRRIDFTVRVPEFNVVGKGGAGLVLNPGGERPQRVVFGAGRSGPEIYSLFCEKAHCDIGKYEDFVEGRILSFERGETLPATVTIEGGRLRLSVRGAVIGHAPAPTEPITSFSFDMFADAGESWTVAVDNLAVH